MESTVKTRLQSLQLGEAQTYKNIAIHAAFFRLDEAQQPDRMASYRARHRHVYE